MFTNRSILFVNRVVDGTQPPVSALCLLFINASRLQKVSIPSGLISVLSKLNVVQAFGDFSCSKTVIEFEAEQLDLKIGAVTKPVWPPTQLYTVNFL